MAAANVLSENDVRILQGVINDVKVLRVQSQKEDSNARDQTAPEVYIALTPDDGIPALSPTGVGDDISISTGTGTGTTTIEDPGPTAGDTPGSAVCTIYRVIGGTLSNTRKTRTVYNLSLDAIAESWVPVTRDKYGTWVALVTGDDSSVIKEGQLTTALAPATNARIEPSTASLAVIEIASPGGSAFFSGETILVTTRFTEISTIPIGTWLIARRMGGEWRPIAADCGVTQDFDTGTGT